MASMTLSVCLAATWEPRFQPPTTIKRKQRNKTYTFFHSCKCGEKEWARGKAEPLESDWATEKETTNLYKSGRNLETKILVSERPAPPATDKQTATVHSFILSANQCLFPLSSTPYVSNWCENLSLSLYVREAKLLWWPAFPFYSLPWSDFVRFFPHVRGADQMKKKERGIEWGMEGNDHTARQTQSTFSCWWAHTHMMLLIITS